MRDSLQMQWHLSRFLFEFLCFFYNNHHFFIVPYLLLLLLSQLSQYSDGLRTERPGFDSRQGQEIFLHFTISRPALGPTQPPIQWEPGAFSPGVQWPRREADHSPSSSAEVKNGGAIPPLPGTSSWIVLNWLINYKENFAVFRTYLPPIRMCDIRQHSIISSFFKSRTSFLIPHLAHYGEMKFVIIYLFIQIGVFKDEIFSKEIPIFRRSPDYTHYATIRKVEGLIPDEVIGFFNWPNPSSRSMALGSTQPLTEMSTRNLRDG
jgi:hypothetical protein